MGLRYCYFNIYRLLSLNNLLFKLFKAKLDPNLFKSLHLLTEQMYKPCFDEDTSFYLTLSLKKTKMTFYVK